MDTEIFRTFEPTIHEFRSWLETKGYYIELYIDGWGNNECVSTKNIGYRSFIWIVGQPRPEPHDDIGMLPTHDQMLTVSLLHCFALLEKELSSKHVTTLKSVKE